MSNIVFFGIPAHGHTNPTLGVVKELISRGHQVWKECGEGIDQPRTSGVVLLL